MAAKQGLIPIFGGFAFNQSFKQPDEIEEVYKALKEAGCDRIDTARIYGEAETNMGNTGAGTTQGFTIDSKAPGGFGPGTSTRKGVVEQAKESLKELKMDKVNVYYLHAPDKSIDLYETLAGVQEVYKAGHFTYFGLSNYTAQGVQDVYDHCKEKGYVLPTHFQGNYNPVSRHIDTDLLPTLRKLGISFYAYSPLAGGFLTKTKEQIAGGGDDAGRFASSNMLSGMYKKLYSERPKLLQSLELWEEIAQKANVSKAELAYRWMSFNSPLKAEHGDGIIFGASKISQITSTVSWIKKGPFEDDIAKQVDKVWDLVKDEAPLNNMDAMG